MDQIVYPKNNALADAFTALLSIHKGRDDPEEGKIWKRRMMNGNDVFLQFTLADKNQKPLRYCSVKFYQWDGYLHLYTNTPEEMKPYLPRWETDFQRAFHFDKFYNEQHAKRHLYSLDEVETACWVANEWLSYAVPPPAKSAAQLKSTLESILSFKEKHNPNGHMHLSIDDLLSAASSG